MRYKKPYTLVPRRTRKGKIFYRYRVWDPVSGKRVEFSTGKKSRDSAEKFCEYLRQKGQLVPTLSPPPSGLRHAEPLSSPPPLFTSFAKDWWGPQCPYCRAESARGKHLSRTYKALCEIRLRKQILPTFGHLPLGSITTNLVDTWHLAMAAKPRVANSALSTLQVMLNEAVRLGLVGDNPCKRVKPVIEVKKTRELFTSQEISDLFFSDKALKVWKDDREAYLAALVVSRSGLRAGEVLGLQVGALAELSTIGWITVSGSWDRKQLKETKTKTERRIPIPKEVATLLESRTQATGFLFSDTGGEKPISYFRLRKYLVLALEAIGISTEEQRRRGLGLHAFRHWINTRLRGKVSDDAIRATIGHTTEEMTDHYTSHDTETLAPVEAALKEVFKGVRHD